MPIPLEQFEKGEDVPSLTPHIMKFFFDNRDKAFTLEEIEKAILREGDNPGIILTWIVDVLDEMQKLGALRCKRFPNPEGDGYIMYFTVKHPSTQRIS